MLSLDSKAFKKYRRATILHYLVFIYHPQKIFSKDSLNLDTRDENQVWQI